MLTKTALNLGIQEHENTKSLPNILLCGYMCNNYQKFTMMVSSQGGILRYMNMTKRLPLVRVTDVHAKINLFDAVIRRPAVWIFFLFLL